MKVKICGLREDADIDYVNEALPDMAGFIIDYPKSHRSIDIKRAGIFSGLLDKRIETVAVIVDKPLEEAAKMGGFFNYIQLHGEEDSEYILRLKKLTDAGIIKSFIIDTVMNHENSKRVMEEIEHCPADLVLIDTGRGGGKIHREENLKVLNGLKRKYILAGGITGENIDLFGKYKNIMMFDISGGVETDGKKDRIKINETVGMIKNLSSE